YTERTPVTVDDLQAVIAAEGVTPEPGDVLLVRTGWMAFYLEQSLSWRRALSRNIRVPGLESVREMAEFLWDWHIAAVAADNYAVENFGDTGFTLHANVLGLLGIPLGEFWYLEDLATDCAADGRYEFLLT